MVIVHQTYANKPMCQLARWNLTTSSIWGLSPFLLSLSQSNSILPFGNIATIVFIFSVTPYLTFNLSKLFLIKSAFSLVRSDPFRFRCTWINIQNLSFHLFFIKQPKTLYFLLFLSELNQSLCFCSFWVCVNCT